MRLSRILLPAIALLLTLAACDTSTEPVPQAEIGTFEATYTTTSGVSASIQGAVVSSANPSDFEGTFNTELARDSSDCSTGRCEEIDVEVAYFSLSAQTGETLVLARVSEDELTSGSFDVTNNGAWISNNFHGTYQVNPDSVVTVDSGTLTIALATDQSTGSFGLKLANGSTLDGTFSAAAAE